MQTITFTAASGGELRQQMLDFLGITYTAPAVMEVQPPEQPVNKAPVIPEPADTKPPVKSRGKIKEVLTGDLSPSGTTTATPAPEPQGSGAPEPGTPTFAEKPGDEKSSELNVPEEFVAQEVVTPPKEALELKEKVIDALQAAFRAGKVQKVRSVLTQYGNGAKSFREIDIAQFPEISKALQSGALN